MGFSTQLVLKSNAVPNTTPPAWTVQRRLDVSDHVYFNDNLHNCGSQVHALSLLSCWLYYNKINAVQYFLKISYYEIKSITLPFL